jgi:DNA replication and repair protein RecF
MFGKPWARLDAHTEGSSRTIKLMSEPTSSKQYELDGKPYRRLSLHHTLPIVLFEPNHLTLLHGAPDKRREYLDDILIQIVASHAAMIRNYKRVLAQRNSLLKRAKKPSNEELFPWNLRLSELGALLARRRSELAVQINDVLERTYQALSNTTTVVSMGYHPQFPLESYESKLLQKLESNLPVDVLRGFTSAGPHREDFVVLFDGHTADQTASRGETRTLILALKVIELQILATAREVQPILLLDDVFSELDGARRHALTDQLKTYQTFITTTDADIVLKNFAQKAQIIPLS